MRVLFWSRTFRPNIGGIEVLAARLLPSLRDRGHEFVVVTPKGHAEGPEESQHEGIPVHYVPFQSTVAPGSIDRVLQIRQRVARLKQRFAPDLVHINGVGSADFFHLTTSHAHPAPVLVTLHGQWRNELDAIVAGTLRAADWVAGCSSDMLVRGRQLAPEIGDRCSVIYNGLEIPPLPREPLRFDEPRLLCLGRLSPEKGLDVALTAFALIAARFPRARLTVAGDGPHRRTLEQQASALGITRVVDFLGWVPPEGVPALMNLHTLVLVPSRLEGFGLVALEAAQMARPVVATRVGGLPEIVAAGQTGLLVDSEDSEAMAEAAAFLLSHPEIAEQFGQAARRRAENAFGWERHVNGYDALYRKLLQ